MVRLVIIILVGVLALSFFGITIQSIVNSPAGQSNFGYLGNLLVSAWDFIYHYINLAVQFLVRITS